jgi:hypothetical protein
MAKIAHARRWIPAREIAKGKFGRSELADKRWRNSAFVVAKSETKRSEMTIGKIDGGRGRKSRKKENVTLDMQKIECPQR